jgi:hypothetical protein
MKLKTVLTISAIYLGVLGTGFMLVPQMIGVGAVPENPSPALIAYLRLFGAPFVGIAVLNWRTRAAAPSPTLDAVVLANVLGFGFATLMDIWGVLGGGARDVAKVFLVVHLLFTVAFVLAGGSSRRSPG